MNDEGKLTGSEIAFLYPDLSTALVGEFNDGRMVRADPAVLVSLQLENEIAVPTFKR